MKYNFDLLHEELEEIPGAVSMRPMVYEDQDKPPTIERVANYTLKIVDGEAVVRGLDKKKVAKVLKAHDRTKKSKKQKARDDSVEEAKQGKIEKRSRKKAVLDKIALVANLSKEEIMELLDE